MYLLGGIIVIVEILVFAACANREMRIVLTPCPNDDQKPARFHGQFVNRGQNKFGVNGTLVIDRNMGFDSTLEVNKLRELPLLRYQSKFVFHSFFTLHRFSMASTYQSAKSICHIARSKSPSPGPICVRYFQNLYPFTRRSSPKVCPSWRARWKLCVFDGLNYLLYNTNLQNCKNISFHPKGILWHGCWICWYNFRICIGAHRLPVVCNVQGVREKERNDANGILSKCQAQHVHSQGSLIGA